MESCGYIAYPRDLIYTSTNNIILPIKSFKRDIWFWILNTIVSHHDVNYYDDLVALKANWCCMFESYVRSTCASCSFSWLIDSTSWFLSANGGYLWCVNSYTAEHLWNTLFFRFDRKIKQTHDAYLKFKDRSMKHTCKKRTHYRPSPTSNIYYK